MEFRPEASSASQPSPDDDAPSSSGQSNASFFQLPAINLASGKTKTILLILLVLVFGVANRVLYRIALVPMKDHTFFLAQFQNTCYLLTYWLILHLRRRSGRVTDEMLKLNKWPFVIVGLCESLSQLLFMYGAGHLPGILIPVINQSYLVWNLIFATIVLRAKFTKSQLFGASLVVCGVCLASAPPALLPSWLKHLPWQSAAAQNAIVPPAVTSALSSVDPKHVIACVACFAFPALASTVKERLFKSAKAELGRDLDIFVVNSFSSLFQVVFVLLLLPITLSLHHVSLTSLPEYLIEGSQCFQGLLPGSQGSPFFPVAYVITNLIFNISILTLLRSVGSVSTTICGSCLVPLTILAFTQNLPLLETVSVGPSLVAGISILLTGLLLYNFREMKKAFYYRSVLEETIN